MKEGGEKSNKITEICKTYKKKVIRKYKPGFAIWQKLQKLSINQKKGYKGWLEEIDKFL